MIAIKTEEALALLEEVTRTQKEEGVKFAELDSEEESAVVMFNTMFCEDADFRRLMVDFIDLYGKSHNKNVNDKFRIIVGTVLASCGALMCSTCGWQDE